MINNFTIIGRLTRDPETRYTKGNKAVTLINIAVNNGKDDTTFIRLTAFDKLAELVSKYCKKGDLIGTQSIIKNHNWEDKNGNKHYDYSFIINKISFLPKANKEEVKKQDNTSVFQEFGDSLEIDVENMLD